MKKLSLIIHGLAAAAVEEAARASFYGIHGNAPVCTEAMNAVLPIAEKAVNAAHPKWNWFMVLDARPIDTAGTRTPYAAELIIEVY